MFQRIKDFFFPPKYTDGNGIVWKYKNPYWVATMNRRNGNATATMNIMKLHFNKKEMTAATKSWLQYGNYD